MKRKLSVILSLILVITIFTACSTNGKVMLEKMRAAQEIKISEQEYSQEIKIELKTLLPYFEGLVLQSFVHNAMNDASLGDGEKSYTEVFEQAHKKLAVIKKMIDENPTMIITIKGTAYSDVKTNLLKPEIEEKVDINLKALGLNYDFNNVKIFYDGEKIYISTSLVKGLSEAFVDYALKLTIIDNQTAKDAKLLASSSDMFNKNYLTMTIVPEHSEIEMAEISKSINVDEMQKIYNELIDTIAKEVKLSKDVKRVGNTYSVELDVKDITKLIYASTKAVLNNEEFLIKLMNGIGLDNTQLEMIDMQMANMVGTMQAPYFKNILSMMNGLFEHSKLKLAISYDKGIYKQEMVNEVYISEEKLVEITQKVSTKSVNKRTIAFPKETDCFDINGVYGSNSEPEREENANLIEETKPQYNLMTAKVNGKEYKFNAFNMNECYTVVNLKDMAKAMAVTNMKFDYKLAKEKIEGKETEVDKLYITTAADYSKASEKTEALKNTVVTQMTRIEPQFVMINNESVWSEAYIINGEVYIDFDEILMYLGAAYLYNENNACYSIYTE